MMYKIKKQKEFKVFLFAITALFFSTILNITTSHVYASGLLDFIQRAGAVLGDINNFANNPVGAAGSVIKDALGGTGIGEMLTNYIADTILDGAVGWIGNLYEELASSVIYFTFDAFRPDVATFNTYVTEEYFLFLPTIGYIIAIFLLVAMIIIINFGAIQWAEVKESAWRVIGGFLISCLLIHNSNAFVNMFFQVANYLWDKALGTTSLDISSEVAQMAVPVTLVSSLIDSSTSVLGVIMVVIFGVIFLKSFCKFAMEVIERYIVACALYYICPLTAATLTSKNASAVFKKYIQMLVVQLIMLFMNLIFIRGIAMMIASSLTYSFTGFLFLLAFMKVGQRIDNYAFTMGLSVAVTGGSLLDATGGVGRNFVNMARGIQMGAGMAGNALVAKGSAIGDLSMLKKGMDLQNASRPSGMFGAKTSQSDAINRASRLGSATEVAKSLTPQNMDQSMVDMVRTGRNNSVINEMSMDAKQALFEKAYGSDLLPEGATLKSLSWSKQGDCFGEMDVPQIGLNGEEGNHFTTSFKVSDQANSEAILKSTNDNDTAFYLTSKGGMQVGDSITVNPNDSASVASAEMISGMNFDALGDMKGQIHSVSMDADNSLLMMDEQGDTLARMEHGRNGQTNIAFNDDFMLSEDSIGKLPSMQHLNDICLEDNGDGTVSLFGKNNNTSDIEKYTMFNKALYNRNDVETSTGTKVYSGFGNRNRTTGSWHVVKESIRTKDAKESVNRQYEFAKARSANRDHLSIPRYKNS